MADNKSSKRSNTRDKGFRRPRKKICAFCADKNLEIDYKDVEKIKKFVSDKGKILPRRATGTCALHQRKVTEAVKRARTIALLPYTVE